MRIVIIGGGFAGLNLTRALAKKKEFEVILVDRNNYNFFTPLIYQVATAFLEPSSISYPFRKLFEGKANIHFRLGELLKVIPAENKVVLSNGELMYDQLVFAAGAESNYFGNENIKRSAIPMKTMDDAIEMRNRLLGQIELASITTDPGEIKKLLTVVIAGGGPTGVEIAGIFAEMKNTIFRKEYPELLGAGAEIYLVDGGKAVLAPMSEKSQQYTYDTLIKMGVKIKLNCQVKDFANDTVSFSNGESIGTKNLIWAAGITGRVFEGVPAESNGRGKRMIVDEYNKVLGTQNIFSIGDGCIQLTDKNYPNGHPQLAQVAIQQGKHLAKNLLLATKQKPLKAFKYSDIGTMAIIGRNKAVADLPKPKLNLHGFFAWAAWLFIHLMSLVTYRNRILTLYNWVVAYFTKDQSLRLIIKPDKVKT